MNGDTDKRMVLGSDRPCEGVATSLRFPSKTGSFTPGNYGSEAGPPDEQPDSPIKTSPVSERIKALEALAAQKKQPDFRSDRSFSHFRDHHNEKSLTESSKSPFEKTTPTKTTSEVSTNQESPQSPFEILGDFRQINEFEETEKWMKAHLPPVPNFNAVDLIKGTLTSDDAASKEEKETDIVIPDVPAAFAGVPDAFMDSPVKVPKQKDTFCDTWRQPSVEEKSEFDLTFLPTAYIWDQHEKSGAEHPTDPNSVLPPSPAVPTGFGSSPSVLASDGTGPKQDISAEKKPTCEAESSGESEDTVIEDGAPVPSETCDPTVLNDGTTILDSIAPNLVEEKETPPLKSERKLMQVPTINVIETDEPNYSDEEMELEAEEVKDYEVVKELSTEVPKSPEPESEDSENEPTRTRPLETEFIEGYSPPSSPVDSDSDHSPKHKITECLSETVHQESASKPEELFNQNILKDSPSDLFQVQYGNEETSSLNDEKMDFADNDDEWSDEAQDVLVKTCKTDVIPNEASTQFEVDEKSNMAVEGVNKEGDIVSRTSFMQDEIYDRQSFDNDYNASSALDDIDGTGQNNAKERFLSGSSQAHVETLIANTAQNEGSGDDQNLGDLILGNEGDPFKKSVARDYPHDPYSCFKSEPVRTINEQDLSKIMSPDSNSENMANENSLSGKTNAAKYQQDIKMAHYVPDTTNTHVADSERSDSFVDFMRECLKSTQDKVEDAPQSEDSPSKNKIALPSQFPPTMVMDLEQEQLTISALKELGSSQEEEEEETVSLLSKVPGQDDAKPTSLSIKQSPVTSVSNPACSQSNLVLDSSYSKEVEAIDKWVAEAYHLAEHVLTAILTHLSGNTSSLWAVGLLTSCSLFKQIIFLTCTLHLPNPKLFSAGT